MGRERGSMASDEGFMSRALELAELGAGWVDPNPMVGCIIVDADGDVIGEGWHRRFGGLHAEREALADCAARGSSSKGATVYVTLEPCCHWGKTPPCTEALIEAGVARVVVGCLDANPLVASAGAKALEDAGIEVEVGVLESECKALNRAFFHFIETGRPYVVAKYAVSLDGRIAAHTGKSKWITGAAAREHVHASRSKFAAVMAGIGTVLADDPMLNCRLEVGYPVHQPMRVVCDAHLRTPLDSKLVRTAKEFPVAIAVGEEVPEDAAKPYLDAGCSLIRIPSDDGRLDLDALMTELGKLGVDSVYAEGGPTLLGSLLDSKLIDYVQAYIAPKLIGGEGARCAIGGLGAESPQDAAVLKGASIQVFGDDLLVEGEVAYA